VYVKNVNIAAGITGDIRQNAKNRYSETGEEEWQKQETGRASQTGNSRLQQTVYCNREDSGAVLSWRQMVMALTARESGRQHVW